MGNRLSKITTRTGDAGTTGLAGQARIAKHAPRIAAIGDVDELNCALGLLACHELPAAVSTLLQEVQNTLFNVGGELAMPGMQIHRPEALEALEAGVDALNAELPPLKEFVIPGGNPAAASAHMARAVCRRAERSLWALHADDPIRPELPQYLNRLSDWLFVVARTLMTEPERQWRKEG